MKRSIQKELRLFQEFKKNYAFSQKKITYVHDKAFCDGFPLEDEENNIIPVCDSWINVGYKLKNPLSKLLSNLFPYEFELRGEHLHSIESFFKELNFLSPKCKNMFFPIRD